MPALTTEEMEQVEYREVPGYPAYRVGSDGSVWSRWKRVKYPGKHSPAGCVLGAVWKRLKPGKFTTGRYGIGLSDGSGKVRRKEVHRLVLEAFAGPCPEGMEACHNDGNHLNNAISNLRWDTHRANMADRARHGTLCRGSKQGQAKLTEEKVREIRRRLAAGEKQRDIAAAYGVSQYAIGRINRGQAWTHA